MHLKARYKVRKAKIKNWLYDHLWAKSMLNWSWIFIISTLSALCFAFGFNTFIDIITVDGAGNFVSDNIVSGGVSGLSQSVVLFFRVCGWDIKDTHLAISILYFIINAPLMVIAWFKVGRQFAVFTLINVIEVSVLIRVMNVSNLPGLQLVIDFVNEKGGGLLARALFGGIFIGLSSALAYRMDISAGGLDVIAYFLSLRKGTSTGKYSFLLNFANLLIFTLLSFANIGWNFADGYQYLARAFYSLVYFFTSMLVVDAINLRNKKVKLEVITEYEELGDILLDSIPHGVTIVRGEGAFSHKQKFIFTMVVSHYEVPSVVRIIRKEDPHAFVETTAISQIYGNFTNRPIK